jgi:hypothetical protein
MLLLLSSRVLTHNPLSPPHFIRFHKHYFPSHPSQVQMVDITVVVSCEPEPLGHQQFSSFLRCAQDICKISNGFDDWEILGAISRLSSDALLHNFLCSDNWCLSDTPSGMLFFPLSTSLINFLKTFILRIFKSCLSTGDCCQRHDYPTIVSDGLVRLYDRCPISWLVVSRMSTPLLSFTHDSALLSCGPDDDVEQAFSPIWHTQSSGFSRLHFVSYFALHDKASAI